MKTKSEYVCRECGYVSPKWNGKCQGCGAWNTMEEEIKREASAGTFQQGRGRATAVSGRITPLSTTIPMIDTTQQARYCTGLSEFDRVLGGGIVDGSVVLLSGEPGIGKSTLLLQICGILGDRFKLLYVSGEESPAQLKMRAQRLGVAASQLMIYTETDIAEITTEIELVCPQIVVIDSIQTMTDDDSSSMAGSVSQVKNVASKLIRIAKTQGIAIILVGHVNKDGAIAGPKVLEHMVDAVLYFDGEKQYAYRILRAAKNRFGSTNEIGIFEMGEQGLAEVENPSEYLLAQRPINVSGNCTLCIMEGTRPILAEAQALVTPTVYPSPKRMATGFDYNRMSLIAAVLEKRLGLRFSTQDVYVNIVGGLRVDEPASDLAVALALISGWKDLPLDDSIVAVGELGLSGECRAVGQMEQRVKECVRLGFQKIVLPYRNAQKLKTMEQYQHYQNKLVPVKSLFDALKLFAPQS